MTIYLIARILWMIFYKAPARETYKPSAMLSSTTSSLAFFCLEATAAILHANGDKFEFFSVGGFVAAEYLNIHVITHEISKKVWNANRT
jgi:hypothetical protein